mgnify:CR=1 FL=1
MNVKKKNHCLNIIRMVHGTTIGVNHVQLNIQKTMLIKDQKPKRIQNGFN